MAKKYINTGNKDTRSGFGAGLLEAGRKNPNIVALAADLAGSVKMDAFAKEFPERFFQCGIAEANMIGAAAPRRQSTVRRLIRRVCDRPCI